MRSAFPAAAMAAVLLSQLVIGCAGNERDTASAGSTAPAAAAPTSGGGLIPSLVNVDLRNVLNDLAVRLNLDRANVPINAQIPITLAVNICGVSVNVLSASTGGQANCTATTSSPELAQEEALPRAQPARPELRPGPTRPRPSADLDQRLIR